MLLSGSGVTAGVTDAPGNCEGGCVEDEGACITVVADEAPGCEDEAAAGDTDGEAVGVFEAADDCVAFAAASAAAIGQVFVWTAVACVSVEAVRPE